MKEIEMIAHVEHDNWKRQRERNPEAPRHIGELAAVGYGRRLGLKRHAADRTVARLGLTDFRVHRTGIDRACRRSLRLALTL